MSRAVIVLGDKDTPLHVVELSIPSPRSVPLLQAPGFRFDAPGQQHAFNSGGSLAAAWDRGEMDVWKGAVAPPLQPTAKARG